MFETMPLRAKLILSIIIGVVAVTIITIIIWGVVTLGGKQGNSPANTPAVTTSNNNAGGAAIITPPVQPTPPPPTPVAPLVEKKSADQTEQELTAIAMPFAARLGTFSNQSNYDNLPPLMQFMTPRMQAWAQDKIAQAQKTPIDPLYVGTTTKSLSLKVVSSDATSAQVLVSTQRKESKGTVTNARVYNQDITLKFVKVNGVWIVDDALWAPAQ